MSNRVLRSPYARRKSFMPRRRRVLLPGQGNPVAPPATATAWAAADAKLRSNQHPTTKLSIGAGYLGGEIAKIVDCGQGRLLALLGDVYEATGAGQQGALGNNPAHPSAPRTDYYAGGVLMFDNHDISLSSDPILYTLRNADGTPYGFFRAHAYHNQPHFRSVSNGILLSGPRGDRLLVTGGLATLNPYTVTGSWVGIFTDIESDDPTDWTFHELPLICGQHDRRCKLGNCGFHIENMDGQDYLLMWGAGPGDLWSMNRVELSRAYEGELEHGEWWDGRQGFRRDVPDPLDRPANGAGELRGGVFSFTSVESGLFTLPGAGTIHKRPDGRFQVTSAWFSFISQLLGTDHGPYMSRAIAEPGTFGPFPLYEGVYRVPDIYLENGIYNAFAQPDMEWAGMAPTDQVWSYTPSAMADNTEYFGRFLKVSDA